MATFCVKHLARRTFRGITTLLMVWAGCVGCVRLPTYVEAQATARAGGCWPEYLPTPPLVTVTPAAPGVAGTALATATPFVRCPPLPGRTAASWPTPVPPPPAYPTLESRPWQTGSDRDTTLHLPAAVLTLDLAVHPTEGWPALGSVVWSGTNDPERVMLSVYNPLARRWSIARQVDLGQAQIGRYSRSVRLAITADSQVHALWGMSDPDFSDGDPPSGLWASSSSDFGETWSPPLRIASGCRRVNDVAAGLDGTLVVMAVCDEERGNTLAMVTRRADGTWLPVERLPISVRYYSEGSVLIAGSGAEARAIGLALVEGDGVPAGYLVSRSLTGSEPWRVERVAITAPLAFPLGERMWHLRGVSYTRPQGPALTFTWTDAEAGGAYALTSLDGGRSWGHVALIAAPFEANGRILDAIPAYDPAADRLVAIWSCCAAGVFNTLPATHYASWNVPGSDVWHALGGAGPIPLAIGSRAAGETVGAQAANSRFAWVAWVERQKQVEVRSLALNQIIPVAAYPTATPQALPGGRP